MKEFGLLAGMILKSSDVLDSCVISSTRLRNHPLVPVSVLSSGGVQEKDPEFVLLPIH
jgi:hypothetical protein